MAQGSDTLEHSLMAAVTEHGTLTDGSSEVLLHLVGAQGPLPDDELVEGAIDEALGRLPLGARQEVGAGVAVVVEDFASGVCGVQGAVDVDLEPFPGLPGEQDVSPVGTCRAQQDLSSSSQSSPAQLLTWAGAGAELCVLMLCVLMLCPFTFNPWASPCPGRLPASFDEPGPTADP